MRAALDRRREQQAEAQGGVTAVGASPRHRREAARKSRVLDAATAAALDRLGRQRPAQPA